MAACKARIGARVVVGVRLRQGRGSDLVHVEGLHEVLHGIRHLQLAIETEFKHLQARQVTVLACMP